MKMSFNLSANHYDPFGMTLVGRSWEVGSDDQYRFGFQNQEIDNEFWGGAASFEYRVEDTRLGRFFSVDPLTADYPYNSPYAFSENCVIQYVELEGLEKAVPSISSGAIVQSLWKSMGIYNNGDLQHVTEAVARKDAKNTAQAVVVLLLPWEDLILLFAEYAVDAALVKASSNGSKFLFAETKALSVETKAVNNSMTITSSTPDDLYPTIRDNYAKSKYEMPENERVYVNFEESVYDTNKAAGETIYQYRLKMSDGSTNTKMGGYFVDDETVTPEMVGLRSSDYELYKVELNEDTQFFTGQHKKNTSVWNDISGPNVQGGGKLYYKKGVSGSAEKIGK